MVGGEPDDHPLRQEVVILFMQSTGLVVSDLTKHLPCLESSANLMFWFGEAKLLAVVMLTNVKFKLVD